MTERVQLLGISNAIVDVLAHVDEALLARIDAPRGSMTLIDEHKAREVYGLMGPATEVSGGSVANTVANFASLGGRAAYIGRVKADQLGDIFVHDMRSLGVDVRLPPAADGLPTARSYILITPDGQRTMQTYLGACTQLAVSNITPETVGDPEILLVEGYLWDLPEGPALIEKAMAIAHDRGARIALSLSDSMCVDRHSAEFTRAVEGHVDIVFADDDEVMSLFETADFAAVERKAAELGKLFVMTRSEKGSVIVEGEVHIRQEAIQVPRVVDSTGVGDAYTAGFLHGLANGKALDACARFATECATAVIQQVGARIEKGRFSP